MRDVDCSVIDTASLARTLCPSWSSGKAGRFKGRLVAALVTPPSPRYSFRKQARWRQGISMSASLIWPAASGRLRPFRVGALRVFPAIVFLLCASLLVALETPSKPFLEKNSFYLSSAGFRVQLANRAESHARAAGGH